MIIKTPALDYYRATTTDFGRYYDMVQEIVGFEEVDQKWSFQQYKGNRVGAVGHGQAMVDGVESYIVDIPGEAADDAMFQLVFSDMKVTRIDLQITIEKPQHWDTLDFYYSMKFGTWPNVPRHVEARLNDGNDTVYIGSRTSDRYIRVYVKERNFIRFEVEYKRKLAIKSWEEVRRADRKAIAGILLYELSRLPPAQILTDCDTELRRYGTEKIEMKVAKVKTTDEKRIQWLASLLPAIEEMMNDSDYGRMVHGWFLDMVERRIDR